LNVLSICSGIGGLDLFARSLGWRTVAYVEKDEYRQAVLHARMRDGRLDRAPIWPDLRTFDGLEWRGLVDAVVGGFPCQPFSKAGSRRRENDSRNLWPDVARVISEVRPLGAFLENVPGLLHAPYWGTILGDLAGLGYDVRWDLVEAAAAGAPHRRERLWFLAHTGSLGWMDHQNDVHARSGRFAPQLTVASGDEAMAEWNGGPADESRLDRLVDGVPEWMERTEALGDAVVWQQARLAWDLLTGKALVTVEEG
jgi:DNA (cytosine-5)-methyltransferase 1